MVDICTKPEIQCPAYRDGICEAKVKDICGNFKRVKEDIYQWKKDTESEDFPERLKSALKAKKMSQSQFAKICGCSASRISALVNKRDGEKCPKYIWKEAKDHLEI